MLEQPLANGTIVENKSIGDSRLYISPYGRGHLRWCIVFPRSYRALFRQKYLTVVFLWLCCNVFLGAGLNVDWDYPSILVSCDVLNRRVSLDVGCCRKCGTARRSETLYVCGPASRCKHEVLAQL